MERYRTILANVIIPTTCCLLFLPKNLNAQEQTCESLYRQAVDKYHNEEFEEAIRLGLEIREHYPEHPVGVFAILATYQSITINYRVKSFDSQFDSLADLAVQLSKQALKKDKKDGKNYFYLGSAYGFRSMYNAQRKKWVAAFKDGMKISKNFKLAIHRSPEFYDSYYGLGLYNYWIAEKSKALRFLPFVKRGRKKGIEQILTAMNKAAFVNHDAMFAITTIYMNDEKFEKALEMTDRLAVLFPKNPTLQYRRGIIFQSMKRWSEAQNSFEKLYELLQASRYQSYSYQVECLFRIAQCNYMLQNYLEAKTICEDAIALDANCDLSKEMDGPLEKHSEIEKQLAELNDELQSMPLPELSSKD